jgi:hypothetical protein
MGTPAGSLTWLCQKTLRDATNSFGLYQCPSASLICAIRAIGGFTRKRKRREDFHLSALTRSINRYLEKTG